MYRTLQPDQRVAALIDELIASEPEFTLKTFSGPAASEWQITPSRKSEIFKENERIVADADFLLAIDVPSENADEVDPRFDQTVGFWQGRREVNLAILQSDLSSDSLAYSTSADTIRYSEAMDAAQLATMIHARIDQSESARAPYYLKDNGSLARVFPNASVAEIVAALDSPSDGPEHKKALYFLTSVAKQVSRRVNQWRRFEDAIRALVGYGEWALRLPNERHRGLLWHNCFRKQMLPVIQKISHEHAQQNHVLHRTHADIVDAAFDKAQQTSQEIAAQLELPETLRLDLILKELKAFARLAGEVDADSMEWQDKMPRIERTFENLDAVGRSCIAHLAKQSRRFTSAVQDAHEFEGSPKKLAARAIRLSQLLNSNLGD